MSESNPCSCPSATPATPALAATPAVNQTPLSPEPKVQAKAQRRQGRKQQPAPVQPQH